MAEFFKGAPVSAALSERIRADVQALGARGVMPRLAIVRAGASPDDLAYERGASKRAAALGVETEVVALPADVTQARLLDELARLNAAPEVHGILLLRPLPAHIDEAAACNAILPDKDVDGVTNASLAAVFTGAPHGFAPCTAAACIALLDHYGVELAGKRAVVVGRSLVVGRPLAMLLLHRNATVTLCHTRTRDLAAMCREADILVAAAGREGVVGAAHVSAGQVVLDVGIHVREDGTLCGDVAFDEVEPVVAAVTPVPGGVGSVTTAVLLQHVVQAARRQNGLDA